jgi:hypothetical protein
VPRKLFCGKNRIIRSTFFTNDLYLTCWGGYGDHTAGVELSGLLFLLLCWGVHCGIYESSYSLSNISYLNSPPPSFSFILYPASPFLKQFSQVSFFHLHTCRHRIYTIFTLPSSFPTSSLQHTGTNSPQPTTGPVLSSCSLIL